MRGDTALRALAHPDRRDLHVFAKAGDEEKAETYLEHYPFLVDSPAHALAGRSPLHVASESGRAKIVSLLIERNAKLDVRDHLQRTPVYFAVKHRHHQCARLLLDAGANPDLADNLGVVPLHLAAYQGQEKSIRELLRFGADVNLRTPQTGLTPLMLASVRGRDDVAMLLITTGASINARTRSGATALDMAGASGNAGLVEQLKVRGAESGTGVYSIEKLEAWVQ